MCQSVATGTDPFTFAFCALAAVFWSPANCLQTNCLQTNCLQTVRDKSPLAQYSWNIEVLDLDHWNIIYCCKSDIMLFSSLGRIPRGC